MIDKTLGNIFKSHSSISFISLLNVKKQVAKVIYYMAKEHLYEDVQVAKEQDDLDEMQNNFEYRNKVSKAQKEKLKQRTEKVIEMAM